MATMPDGSMDMHATIELIPASRLLCILSANHELGEGAIYDYRSGCYFHVDILGHAMYMHNVDSREVKKYDMPSSCSTVVPCVDRNSVLVTLQDGFYRVPLDNASLECIAKPLLSEGVNTRFNDGKCGPDGSFWAGTMGCPPGDPVGALYCLKDDKLVISDTNIKISNGIAWSLDGGTMYYIDTPTRRVLAYDYDTGSASISNKRVAFHVAEIHGWPDGCTLDSEGMLWVAMWDGGRVVRFDPCSGCVLTIVHVPTSKVSSCAFGGSSFDDLYITTAWEHMTPEQKAADPQAGNVFLLKASGYTGLPCNLYRPSVAST